MFAGLHQENTNLWIQSTQSKFTQVGYPRRLWASEISLCVTGAALHFVSKWLKPHPDHSEDCVTSDKLLLTMHTGKPQLQDSNPDTLWAASPQDQPPGRPQILGQEPEQDLTLENPLKLDELKSPTLTLPTLNDPVNPANQRAGLAIEPEITWATTEGETKKLPIERRPPRDDQPHNPTREFEYSQFKPANELTLTMDATKDWKNLVDGNTRAKEICKSLPMTDGHTYTLDHQEVTHCHSCNKVT
ncbi:hypothetical protein DSO57_1013281 [Entomophthora muscae]|uniref:Uncharacterized protein n=1 Tax=Entomophthora muscae TaxID=34485 RepID=A0ACC2U418_9FUNG|nr:hypothetical protein DSO57_1013281 [Entomophthora muscae]